MTKPQGEGRGSERRSGGEKASRWSCRGRLDQLGYILKIVTSCNQQEGPTRVGCWSARRVAGGKAGGEVLTAMEITSWCSTKSSTPPSTTSMRSWSFLAEGLSARWPSAGRRGQMRLLQSRFWKTTQAMPGRARLRSPSSQDSGDIIVLWKTYLQMVGIFLKLEPFLMKEI